MDNIARCNVIRYLLKDLTFAKKAPKVDYADPRRIKKDLQKLAKALDIKDRIMLVATTSKPWDLDLKGVTCMFIVSITLC